MKKFATLILSTALLCACEKEVALDTTENPEPETTVESEYSKIIGTYSGTYEREFTSYTDFMDDGEPPSYYTVSDSGTRTIEVDSIGINTIRFLNLHHSLGAEPGPLNVIEIDSLDKPFENGWSGYGWVLFFNGYFHGEDLEYLHLEATEAYGTSDDAHEDWDSETYTYDLTKD